MTTSVAADWHRRAGVRVDPRRVLQDELDRRQVLFPHRLIPHLQHDAVRALAPAAIDSLVVLHLYQYLQFTAAFELRVVNRAAERVATGRAGIAMSAADRFTAYGIYCDEGYHALASEDLVQQVEALTGVPAPAYDAEPFVAGLDAVGAAALPDEPQLAQLLQVVVFETLVTSILQDVPRDHGVVSAVRETVRDHARDEGRHHAFFSHLFAELWAQLDTRTRHRAALALPALVVRSLAPDVRPARHALQAVGLSPATAEDVVTDVYGPVAVRARTRVAARHSLHLFSGVGVLDVPGARDCFAEAGLVERGPQ